MQGRNLVYCLMVLALTFKVHATDLNHSLAGDDVEDVLGKSDENGNSPFIVGGESQNNVENSKAKGVDYIFNHGVTEVTGPTSPKAKYEESGYTLPGTFEKQENYLEIDKLKMARDFRIHSTMALNLNFIKNDFDYQSTNDIINRTIGEGYKSARGGTIHVRYDSYIVKTKLLNAHWALGAGLGFSSGKGIFAANGQRSETTFKLWEVPVDLGVGLELPVSNLFKLSGTFGPSVVALVQNRSDFQKGEKGKRKYQFSPGYFADAQFKINLSGMSEDMAYKIFTESEITNLYMNLEARVQQYSNFQDPIEISGASFGIGFTFEYL